MMEAKDILRRRKGGLTKVGEVRLVERLSKEIRFDQKELWRLVAVYKKYLKDAWYMDLAVFSEFLNNSFGFTEDFFLNRIFLAADINKDLRIDLEEFIRVVAIMLRGSRKEKIKLCFTCYDLSDSNELTRDDVTSLLVEAITESPYKEVNPDVVRDLAEMTLAKMDQDNDGVLSYEEFEKAALNNWLLTESFGQCLPDHRYRAAFLILLGTEQEIESPEDAEETKETV